MYTRSLKVHYKNKCGRCGSWVNEGDRYCPVCGYKVAEEFNPKFDNFSVQERYTQRLLPNDGNNNCNVKLKFTVPDTEYKFTVGIVKEKFYIGSSSDCLIVVKREYISRFHALFSYDFSSGKLYISDNNSTNGTYLNGEKLMSGHIKEVKENDKIGLSDSFSFVFSGRL